MLHEGLGNCDSMNVTTYLLKPRYFSLPLFTMPSGVNLSRFSCHGKKKDPGDGVMLLIFLQRSHVR